MSRHTAILEFWEPDHGNGVEALEIRIETPDSRIRFVLLPEPRLPGPTPTADSLRRHLSELQDALAKALGPDGAVVVSH